jgi:ActR/RegA family two-component response regulator
VPVGVAPIFGVVASDTPEFALADLRPPGKSGLDLVNALKELDAATSIVVLTGYGSIATAVDSVKRVAARVLGIHRRSLQRRLAKDPIAEND